MYQLYTKYLARRVAAPLPPMNFDFLGKEDRVNFKTSLSNSCKLHAKYWRRKVFGNIVFPRGWGWKNVSPTPPIEN